MKKFFVFLLLLVSALVFMGCDDNVGGPSGHKEDTGKTLVIYCWNEEFKNRFKDYYFDFTKNGEKLPNGVKVEFVMTPSDDNQYQNSLDETLPDNESLSDEKRIDLFLVEADYALKYVNSEYTLDIINEVGLTEKELENQYQYTKDIVTSSDGKLKGTSWQATPGLFAYRRSLAEEVLGTDDPVEVQKRLADWEKFEEVAELMKEKGYYMLSGYDDAYRPFANNISKPMVINDTLKLDQKIFDWIDQTKKFTDNGWNQKSTLWSDVWAQGQGPEGKVFGYFYSTWGINFTLYDNSLENPEEPHQVGNGLYGDWAVCEGPASFYWGGTWICAAKGTDNLNLVRDIMRKLTCDRATMKLITLETLDFTNHKAAMQEIADDPEYGSSFLGGQNHIALFVKAADKIDMKNASFYDQTITEQIQTAMKDYFDGNVTKDVALENFYKAIKEVHKNLKIDKGE